MCPYAPRKHNDGFTEHRETAAGPLTTCTLSLGSLLPPSGADSIPGRVSSLGLRVVCLRTFIFAACRGVHGLSAPHDNRDDRDKERKNPELNELTRIHHISCFKATSEDTATRRGKGLAVSPLKRAD